MHEIVQFGQGVFGPKYDFTAAHVEQVTRLPVFGNTLTNSSRLIGLDGSFNNNFRRRAPSAAGNVRLVMNLLGDGTLSDMEGKLQVLMEMLAWGEQRLFKTLDDGTLLWTWATVTNIRPQFNEEGLSYLVNSVEIDWTCPTARWYGKDGLALADTTNGWTVPGPKVDRVTRQGGEVISIANDGNAPAGAYMWFESPFGNSYSNPGLTRYVSGVTIAEQVIYNDTLSSADVVAIDARNHETQLNNSVVGDYDRVSTASATWMELLPGNSTLVVMGSGAAGVILTVDCWDTYY